MKGVVSILIKIMQQTLYIEIIFPNRQFLQNNFVQLHIFSLHHLSPLNLSSHVDIVFYLRNYFLIFLLSDSLDLLAKINKIKKAGRFNLDSEMYTPSIWPCFQTRGGTFYHTWTPARKFSVPGISPLRIYLKLRQKTESPIRGAVCTEKCELAQRSYNLVKCDGNRVEILGSHVETPGGVINPKNTILRNNLPTMSLYILILLQAQFFLFKKLFYPLSSLILMSRHLFAQFKS